MTTQNTTIFPDKVETLCKCNGAEMSTLLSCLKWMEANTNEVVLSGIRRKQIAKECGIKYNTVLSSVGGLLKSNLLIREGFNTYIVNPELFFKGSERQRGKLINKHNARS